MKAVLELHNDISEVSLLAEWIEQVGEEFQLPASCVFQLNLALEEAVVNVMNYAYPGQEGMPVLLTAEAKDDGTYEFVLEDEGVEFDPTQSEEPDISLAAEDRPIGGLGIFLVMNIMKEVTYERRSERNVLRMSYKP